MFLIDWVGDKYVTISLNSKKNKLNNAGYFLTFIDKIASIVSSANSLWKVLVTSLEKQLACATTHFIQFEI